MTPLCSSVPSPVPDANQTFRKYVLNWSLVFLDLLSHFPKSSLKEIILWLESPHLLLALFPAMQPKPTGFLHRNRSLKPVSLLHTSHTPLWTRTCVYSAHQSQQGTWKPKICTCHIDTHTTVKIPPESSAFCSFCGRVPFLVWQVTDLCTPHEESRMCTSVSPQHSL